MSARRGGNLAFFIEIRCILSGVDTYLFGMEFSVHLPADPLDAFNIVLWKIPECSVFGLNQPSLRGAEAEFERQKHVGANPCVISVVRMPQQTWSGGEEEIS